MPLPTPKHANKPLDWFIAEQNSRKIEVDDGIRELCHSIVANGLLQPLIAVDTGHLLSGFRRLKAMLLANELALAKIETAAASIYPGSLRGYPLVRPSRKGHSELISSCEFDHLACSADFGAGISQLGCDVNSLLASDSFTDSLSPRPSGGSSTSPRTSSGSI